MPFLGPDQDTWKLGYTYRLGLEDLPLPKLKSAGLQGVTNAFNENAMRLKRLMLFPAFIGDLAGRMQRYTDVAEFEITGEISKTRYPPDERGEEIFRRMQDLLSLHTARVTEHTQDENQLQRLVEDTVSVGGSAAVILSAANPTATEVYSLLCSYLTAMWTTFETLAGDLWEAALNEKPGLLAQLKGKSNRFKKGKPNLFDFRPAPESLEGKSIRLDQLQYFGWDLRRNMGSLLRSKFDFARLEGIREAYASAFCDQSAEIDALLNDVSIDKLSIMRNAIVHKGARADKEYTRRRKALSNLPATEEGQAIPINGRMCAEMIGETIYVAVKLIAAVDDWLAAH